MEPFAVSLAEKAMEIWPEPIEPWRPEAGAARRRAPAARPLVVGGERVRLLVGGRCAAGEGGRRAARAVARPTFERDGGGWRAAVGRELGERLRVEEGQLVWAGYAFTRAQQPFKV